MTYVAAHAVYVAIGVGERAGKLVLGQTERAAPEAPLFTGAYIDFAYIDIAYIDIVYIDIWRTLPAPRFVHRVSHRGAPEIVVAAVYIATSVPPRKHA